ncbi:MAG: heme exporter protein CcmB [Gammaproteobacteria bacterium]|nr:heme exporter protein CcmB [Gammaproteobacteria bacterium]
MRKDLRQSGRRLAQTLTPLFFFSVVIALFPLAMTPDSEALAKIAGGVVWVAALLAALLSLQTLFRGDFEDGSLELMALSGVPMWFQVIAKQMAHWLLTGLPLVILAPIAAYSLNLNGDAYITLMMALLLGTLVLSSFGAIGAALTVSVGQGGLLFPVLVLPLIVPALILGAKATEFAAQGRDPGGALSLLAALCILSVSLAPFATAASLRVSLD